MALLLARAVLWGARPEAITLSNESLITYHPEVVSPELIKALARAHTRSASRMGVVGINGVFVDKNLASAAIAPLPAHLARPLHALDERLSGVPRSHHEPAHLIDYRAGDFFRGHIDRFALPGRPQSQRIATFLATANDLPAFCAGETCFPLAKNNDKNHTVTTPIPPECVHLTSRYNYTGYIDAFDLPGTTFRPGHGFAVPPRQGSALVWRSVDANGNLSPASQHTGCTLRCGIKRVVVIWIRSTV